VEIPLNVLACTGVVDGVLEVIFQVSEELRELGWTGVKWEAFCLEDCAAGDVVGHVFQELMTVACGWVGRIVRWDSYAGGGSSCWDELIAGCWNDQIGGKYLPWGRGRLGRGQCAGLMGGACMMCPREVGSGV
jgi:hypothetical protein